MTMQILGKEDQVTDDTITTEEKWSLYVDQFVQLSNTDTVSLSRREPFLKRNLPAQVGEEPPLNVETRSGLELKICVNTYKIFFVDNTEDFFRRKKPSSGATSTQGILENSHLVERSKKFGEWVDSDRGWKRGMTSSEGIELVKQYENWTRGNN
jgi:paired amphipathic helix protein Sin3a